MWFQRVLTCRQALVQSGMVMHEMLICESIHRMFRLVSRTTAKLSYRVRIVSIVLQ